MRPENDRPIARCVHCGADLPDGEASHCPVCGGDPGFVPSDAAGEEIVLEVADLPVVPLPGTAIREPEETGFVPAEDGEDEVLLDTSAGPPPSKARPDEMATVASAPPEPAEKPGGRTTDAIPRQTRHAADPANLKGPGENRIGPYAILDEVGRGGMGVVYRAHDPSLKRTVALKVLLGGEHATDDAVARFKREAESVAGLGHHPGIVPVFDIGTDGKQHYFAMAYVDGRSLTRWVEAGDLTPRRSMVIAEQVARALHFAHGHGILHRDIKPDNILLDREGTPSVTDFGLAKDVRDQSRLTVSGAAMGTPQYMSPEQAEGDLENIDARTDVYGLGAALYEMLAHRPPFSGTSFHAVIAKVMREDPVPPRKIDPAVPRDAETICLKALEKSPERRYLSCLEMADDIRRFLDGEPITARPASFVYKLSKRVRRNPALYLSSTFGTLLLLAALFFFIAVKPRLDLASERATDRTAAEAALEARLAPERKAAEMLGKAVDLFQAGDVDGCAAACRRFVETYGARDGGPPEPVPHLRHPDILSEEKYAPLFRPLSFPLAQAHALEARSLWEAGHRERSMQAWASAYGRAKVATAPSEQDVAAPALLEVADRLLELGDDRRATGAFQQFLTSYPEDAQRARAWAGLAESLWRQGRFAPAAVAWSRALQVEPDRDARPMRRCQVLRQMTRLPFPGECCAALDLDGDGKDELFRVQDDRTLVGWRLFDGGLEEIRRLDIERLTGESSVNWDMLATAELDGHPPREILLRGMRARKTVVAAVSLKGKPLGLGGKAHTGATNLVCSPDLDGDGVDEVVIAQRGRPFNVFVYRVADGDFHLVTRLGLPCYILHLAALGRPGRPGEDLGVQVGPFGVFQAFSGALTADGRRLDLSPISPFRLEGHFIDVTRSDSGRREIWIRSFLKGDHKASAERLFGEENLLPPGLYRMDEGADGKPVSFSENLPDRVLGTGDGFHLPSLSMFALSMRTVDKRPGLAFRPRDLESSWAILETGTVDAPGMSTPFAIQADGDEELEIGATQDQELLLLGVGPLPEVNRQDLLGRATRPEERLPDPVLAQAVEMSALGWPAQALALFERASRTTEDPLLCRRAKLGQADSLLRLDRENEALAILRELLEDASAGVGEELLTLVRVLEDRGDFEGALAVCRKARRTLSLPAQMTAFVDEAIERLEPHTRLGEALPLVPPADRPGSVLCDVPTAFGLSPKDNRAAVSLTATRKFFFGRPVHYAGGPFVVEGRLILHRLDWNIALGVGLSPVMPLGEAFRTRRIVGFGVDAGGTTDLPCLWARLSANQVGRESPAVQVRTYPPRLPATLAFRVVYAPEQDRIRLDLSDLEREASWTVDTRIAHPLPIGTYLLALWGGGISGGPSYRCQGGFEDVRFTGVTRRLKEFPDWRPSSRSFALLQRGGALALRGPGALSAPGVDTDDMPYGVSSVPGLDLSPRWTPTEKAWSALLEIAAGLERKDAAGLEAALTEAFEQDPVATFFRLSSRLPLLPEARRAMLQPLLVRKLRENNLAGFASMVQRYCDDADHRPYWPTRGKVPEGLPRLLNTVRGENDAMREQAFLQLLSAFAPPELLGPCFRGTPYQAAARRHGLFLAGQAAFHRGDVAAADRNLTAYLGEVPDDAGVQIGLARLLATTRDTERRNPVRAVALAEKAVALARRPGSQFARELAGFLGILARARFVAGNAAGAVTAQEEALAALPAGRTDLAGEFERALEEYRAARQEG